MAEPVRCPCGGQPECELCLGAGVYRYQPGPRGWMPFLCPTCQGRGQWPRNGHNEPCLTCRGSGHIDPAYPPRNTSVRGFLRDMWRVFFGG
ncbi:MAG: hypothetical protein RMJ56_15070 [Gemmataceae bacterium]|nr:hypothetical protein [Gemmata sp.]MDW8198917.1 hypothetical protein [Gemmataceae bacterium]